MNTKNILYIIVALSFFALHTANAQHNDAETVSPKTKSWEYEVKVGFNIGGTSPLPLPREIRKLSGYNPTLTIPVEGTVTKWLNPQQNWGLTTGLKLENKGMITDARVKNYRTQIVGGGGEKVSGNWTGMVHTKVRNTYLTVPLLVAHKPSERWRVRAGVYFSYMTEGDFSGKVYDGYLREGDPTGAKVEFADGNAATYDFSGELRRFAYGLQAGASWRAYKSFNVNAELSWGLNSIFKSSFDTVSFGMYPVYLTAGVGYVF